jgi:hypothetical protein
MKPHSTLGTCLAACLALAAVSAIVRAEDTAAYKIQKIEAALIDSPDITVGNYRKQTKSKAKWLEVDLSFERADRNDKSFSGDVVVNYYILLNNAAVQPDGKPTLLTGSIKHSDIPVGKQLHAAAFVSPQALQKLFGGKIPSTISQAIIDLGATITANSTLAAIFTLKGSVAGDKGWWETQADKMTTTTGLVLEKENTPFAPLSWDYYLPATVSP